MVVIRLIGRAPTIRMWVMETRNFRREPAIR